MTCTLFGSRIGLRFVPPLVLIAVAAVAPAARAQDEAAIGAVTKMNKAALEQYDNLSFDEARKILTEALDLCTQSGLDNHPIKARTYVHLGAVIMAGGPAGRAEAVKMFQKALAIQPDIKLNEQLANPEVQAAFDEAKSTVSAAPARGEPTRAETGKKVHAAPPPATEGLRHEAIAEAPRGAAVPISAVTEPTLGAKHVVLGYRPAGATDFVSQELREYSPGNWSGVIPDRAAAGDEVEYTLTVLDEAKEVIGQYGTEEAPLVIKLNAAKPAVAKKTPEEEGQGEEEPEPERARPEEPATWFIGLGVGSGVGWVSGKGDQNDQDHVSSGFGLSKLGHVLPEIGYFLDPDVLLSLQVRYQAVSGATSELDPTGTMCGSDHVCSPASGALAVFARVTWLTGTGSFHPYLSMAVGGGQIRHLATFPAPLGNNCGTDAAHPVKCVDTVAAGPILLGPGAGLVLNATSSFGLMVGLNALAGFPNFTFHVDLNAGLVVEL